MDIMKLSPEELGNGSTIKLERCGSEHDIYWKMALEMLDVIKENGCGGVAAWKLGQEPAGLWSILDLNNVSGS